MTELVEAKTLIECVRYFADNKRTFAFMVNLRWPGGVTCPRCNSSRVGFIKTRQVWQCKDCKTKKQFSIKTGTIFEESPLKMDKWLCAIWLIANAKNGVSSHEIGRSLGVTQKTAWFMLQRIRTAMKSGSFEKLSGEVEVDETFVGGKSRNMHNLKRKQWHGKWHKQKTPVFGMKERGGNVIAKVVENTKASTLQPEIAKNVENVTSVYSDQCLSYEGLSKHFPHECCNHEAKVYVIDHVHTNGIENFWSNFKRAIKGSYIQVSRKHLQKYVDESVFRFNNRLVKDGDRFLRAACAAQGKRIRYSELVKQ